MVRTKGNQLTWEEIREMEESGQWTDEFLEKIKQEKMSSKWEKSSKKKLETLK